MVGTADRTSHGLRAFAGLRLTIDRGLDSHRPVSSKLVLCRTVLGLSYVVI